MTALPDGAARARLAAEIRKYERVVVAFSGGVDSATVLHSARAALGASAVAVVGVSPSLASAELEIARRVAREIGAPLFELRTHELDDPDYRANRGDRCFFCKGELYGRIASDPRFRDHQILDGTNASDPAGDRPGMRAASAAGVVSPLRTSGLTKAAVRKLARENGLSVHDRPARPCLASRVAVGTEVGSGILRAVEEVEDVLRRHAFRVYRARTDGKCVRIVVGEAELQRLDDADLREECRAVATTLGFDTVEFCETGYPVEATS